MEENVNIREPEAPEQENLETQQSELSTEEILKKQLEDMTAQYQQMREIAARAQADGINYRNWAEREMRRLKAQGGERAVLAMLPVFDHLEMALNATGADVEALKKGISLVLRQFEEALKNQGVNVIDPHGELFSPLTQEAMGMCPVEDKDQDGTVQIVHRKGFQMAEKVIRPAQVTVGRYTAPAPEGEDQ